MHRGKYLLWVRKAQPFSLGVSKYLFCIAWSHHSWGRRSWQGVRQPDSWRTCLTALSTGRPRTVRIFLLWGGWHPERVLGTPPMCTCTLTQALSASPRGLPTGWFLKDQKDNWFRSACSWFLLRICNLTIPDCFLSSAYIPLIKSSL